MHSRCGVILNDDQSYLMDARLTPIADELEYSTVHDYVAAACSAGARREIVMKMIDAMTTHETSFFRDAAFWKALNELILPQVIAQSERAVPFRVWSAACSTGQEIYSLAALWLERFPELFPNVEFYASDISEITMAKAGEGRFSLLDVNRGINAGRLLRHFEQDGTHYRIKEVLRRAVRWTPFNLLGDAPVPVPPCDLVLCRNVMIYFDKIGRERALRHVIDAARPKGFVGVGATEMLRGTPVVASWYAARNAG